MAMTLVEANKQGHQEPLQRAVVETIARSNGILEVLKFKSINGNSYAFNVEKDLGTVEFLEINGAYTENTGSVERKTEALTILGTESFIDKFLVATANIADLRAAELERKTKQMARTFAEVFVNGDSVANANQFDGIKKRVEATPEQIVDANEAELTLNAMHELLDTVDGANAIITSKAGKREMQKLFDLHPSYVQNGVDAFGRTISYFNDIRIIAIEDTTLPFRAGTVADTQVFDIYAVKFDEDGVLGLQNGSMAVSDLGELETKPGYLTRIEWYVGLMVQNPKALGKLKDVLRAQ
jgi:hypothetical protein